jgi:hypothetical protein
MTMRLLVNTVGIALMTAGLWQVIDGNTEYAIPLIAAAGAAAVVRHRF